MPEFKDRAGTVWSVEITVGSLRRVREATGLKLGELLTAPEPLEQLYRDDELAARVLFELCRDPATNDPFEPFAELLHGSALREGRDAVMEAAANFTLPQKISNVFCGMWRSDRQMNETELASILGMNLATGSNVSAGNLLASSV